jgi:pilus assembly protein CpaB
MVAAATDIKLGTVLTPSDLTTIEIAGATPKGAILKPEQALNRGVIAEIYQGEPILENRLAPPGSGGGMAATIPQGMRAAAVRVDEVVGVAGFVTPGMRVDVLVSGIPPNAPSAQGTITKTVLQNIEVLSAGTDIQKDASGKPQQVQVVNLLVTPEQAESLSLASQLKIQLVLRNPLDTKVTPVSSTAMASLFTDQNAAPAPHKVVVKRETKPATPVYSIQVMNGASTTEEKFSSPEGQH